MFGLRQGNLFVLLSGESAVLGSLSLLILPALVIMVPASFIGPNFYDHRIETLTTLAWIAVLIVVATWVRFNRNFEVKPISNRQMVSGFLMLGYLGLSSWAGIRIYRDFPHPNLVASRAHVAAKADCVKSITSDCRGWDGFVKM